MENRLRKSLNALELRRNISHAIQSPVSSILNLTELVLSGVDGDVNDEVRQDVRNIVDDVKRLEIVLAKLLELCRVDLAEPKVGSVDLSVQIDAALKAAEPKLSLAGKQHKSYIADGLPTVNADVGLMAELLGRLISLVTEISEEGIICISALGNQDYVTICIGGADELSEPSPTHFVELPRGWYKDELALDWLICQRLAECQGGRLWSSHEPGSGLTVNVSLPVSQ
jgi:light-regulated signal transduction histidine kinase (bacteriophytochrome)